MSFKSVADHRIEYNERKGNKLIKKTVENKGLRTWQQGMDNKPTLKYYKTKTKPGYEYLYDGSWESTLLFKVRSGSLETRDRTRRWNGNEWWCESCTRENIRTVENI